MGEEEEEFEEAQVGRCAACTAGFIINKRNKAIALSEGDRRTVYEYLLGVATGRLFGEARGDTAPCEKHVALMADREIAKTS